MWDIRAAVPTCPPALTEPWLCSLDGLEARLPLQASVPSGSSLQSWAPLRLLSNLEIYTWAASVRSRVDLLVKLLRV